MQKYNLFEMFLTKLNCNDRQMKVEVVVKSQVFFFLFVVVECRHCSAEMICR